MTLELDQRQRAMLLEMGVRVWLPGTAFSTVDSAPVQQTPARPANPPAPPLRPVAKVTPPAMPAVTAPAVNAHSAELPTLDASALEQSARQCRDCGLCEGRQNSTLSLPVARTPAGLDSRAHWMVVGDAPDEEEDAAGSAFAGQSGVLLDNMLRALQLQRINPHSGSDPAQPDRHQQPDFAPDRAAYVTNVVKCRPPHGRLPQAADLQQCSAYLQREIALIRPRMILSMGRFANQLLLRETPALTAQPLGKLRGSVRHFAGIPVVVTYHPKALLRNSADKAKAWADLCLAADMLEASSPG